MYEFDLTTFYNLLETFDRTGRRIYPDAWRGTEAFARQVDDPQASQGERAPLLERLKELRHDELLHSSLMVEEAGHEAHQAASEELYRIKQEREGVLKRLQVIPDISDSSVRDHEAYLRRRHVEKELREAFARGELDLLAAPNTLVQWRSWSQDDDFRVYFGLSMLRVPAKHSSCRRYPAFVNKEALDQWLARFELSGAIAGELTPRAGCEVWLKEQVRQFSPKERTKTDYCTEALARFPGLSERAFNSAWDQVVPDTWKSAGRKQKQS